MAYVRPWCIVFALILTVSPAFAVCSDNLGAHIFIEEVRANIEAQCPCDQAMSRSSYVKCAKAVIAGSLANGELPVRCRKDVVRSVTRSTCGRPGSAACCMQDICRVYSSPEICSTRGSVGNTSSCFDACGPHCGNGLIETGEQCDDKNTLSGDGCSSTCRLELPAECTVLSVVEYLSEMDQDAYFHSMLGNARWLGYNSEPIMPIRCVDGSGEIIYFAYFTRPNTDTPALLMSRPSAAEPFQQVLVTATSSVIGELRFVSGMYRVDTSSDPLNPSVVLYDVNDGIPGATLSLLAPIPVLPVCSQYEATKWNCLNAENTYAHKVSCITCAVSMLSCILKPEPFSCTVAALSCAVCLHTECLGVSGMPCNAPNCFRGECTPTTWIGPGQYICKPTTSYCGECEKCVNEKCESMSSLPDAVVAKVVLDQKQCSNGISCAECGWCLWPGWPGGCTALAQEAITYYDCMGFPETTCLGYNIFVPDDTCGMRCGGGLCDIEALYNDAWAQIHICSEANNQPYFPPLPLDEVQWYIPQEQLSCCPGAQNSINR